MDTTTMLHGAGANGSMTTYTVSGSKEDWASMRRIAVAIRSDLDPDHGYIMDILLNGLLESRVGILYTQTPSQH